MVEIMHRSIFFDFSVSINLLIWVYRVLWLRQV